MRTFIDAPTTPAKIGLLAIRKTLSPTWLACAIDKLKVFLFGWKAERLKVIWLKVFLFG
jgi:hypothetical protein